MSGPSIGQDVAHLLTVSPRLMTNRNALAKVANVVANMNAATLEAGVTQLELARLAGISDRSVRTALRQLEALGAVERIQQPRRVLGYRVVADRLDIVREALR